jgi:pilus assembly protein Flp/PilA
VLPVPRREYPKEKKMKNLILKSLNRLHQDEAGQGLVEYALILALVAFAAVIAMQTLAQDINNAFLGIGSILSSYVP